MEPKWLISPIRPHMGEGVVLGDNRSTFFGDQAQKTMLDFDFSTSWPSPKSTDLMPFATQHSNFHSPDLNWENAFIRSPAHDLHAPTLGLAIMTPTSLSRSISSSMEDCNEHYFPTPTDSTSMLIQQESYAPGVFIKCDLGCDMMDMACDGRSAQESLFHQVSRIPNVIDPKEFRKTNIESTPYSEGET